MNPKFHTRLALIAIFLVVSTSAYGRQLFHGAPLNQAFLGATKIGDVFENLVTTKLL
jgi:hypothetical protein